MVGGNMHCKSADAVVTSWGVGMVGRLWMVWG